MLLFTGMKRKISPRIRVLVLVVAMLASPFGSFANNSVAIEVSADLSDQGRETKFFADAIAQGDIIPQHLIVRVETKDLATEVTQHLKIPGVKSITQITDASATIGEFYKIELAKAEDEAIKKKDLEDIAGVISVAPNVVYRASLTPNDALFGSQWALNNTGQTGGTVDADIDGPESWDAGTGATSVVVAIVDSGVDVEHAEFSTAWPVTNERIWKNPLETSGSTCIADSIDNDANGLIDDCFGYDFVGSFSGSGTNAPRDNDPTPCGTNIFLIHSAPDLGDCNGVDDNGDGSADNLIAHGTHIAGIVGAIQGNTFGISGVAPGISLMPIRALTEDGTGETADVLAALNYAITEGADVINMSFGSNVFDSSFNAIVAAAIANDVVLVAAAGNLNENLVTGTNCDSPVCNDDPNGTGANAVTTVAATTDRDRKASFSNYSTMNYVDVSAPGSSVLSVCYDTAVSFPCSTGIEPNEFLSMSGTSQATPHASGVAALLRSSNPSLTAAQVGLILRTGGDDIDSANVGLGGCGGFDCTTDANGTIGGSRLNGQIVTRANLIGVSPATGSRGSAVSGVSVAGINTTFGAGSVISFGSGIDVANQSCTSPTFCTVDINITNSAPLGPHTVTVTTGAEVVSGFNFFTVTDAILRIAGANRRLTAVEVSKNGFPAAGSADAVVITRDDTFPDSLTGAPLASLAKGPLLFTKTNSLDSAVSAEVLRVLDPAFDAEPDIYILGFGAAISANVEASLNALNNNWQVKRLGGNSRDETAIAIAEEETALRGGPPSQVFIATNSAFPDALAAAVPAGDPNVDIKRIPILLTKPSSLSTPVANYLSGNSASITNAVIVGGTSAVSLTTQGTIDSIIATVTRLSGADRYATAKAVSDNYYLSPVSVSFASGLNFPDALAGGWHSSLYHSPLVLIKGSEIPQPTRDFVTSHAGSLLGGFMYGGASVIPDSVRATLEGLI